MIKFRAFTDRANPRCTTSFYAVHPEQIPNPSGLNRWFCVKPAIGELTGVCNSYPIPSTGQTLSFITSFFSSVGHDPTPAFAVDASEVYTLTYGTYGGATGWGFREDVTHSYLRSINIAFNETTKCASIDLLAQWDYGGDGCFLRKGFAGLLTDGSPLYGSGRVVWRNPSGLLIATRDTRNDCLLDVAGGSYAISAEARWST